MRLLIVDDEIYVIQGILDGVDWSRLAIDEIVSANSYAQAVNHFVKESFDILLCDIEMPYGSGLDLVEWVKENYPETECIFLTCHSEFDFARQALQLKAFDYVLKPAAPAKIVQVLDKAIGVILERQKLRQYEEYGRRYVKELGKSDEKSRPRDVVESVKQYVQENISEPLTVEEIAGQMYVSPDHLTRLFKKQQGQTVIDYITEQRMALARELIEQNELTITMIAAKVGYNNYSYFTKLFKKYYGQTPRDYQIKAQKR